MKNNIGIWIDSRIAKITSIRDGKEEMNLVQSNIEEFNPTGGSGSKVKGGPQDVVQDNRYLERKKNQSKVFYKDVISQVKNADSIVIFGPAQTGEELYKAFSEVTPDTFEKVRGVKKTNSMTDNQIKAWVKDYFSE
jgi:hypothetical protein